MTDTAEIPVVTITPPEDAAVADTGAEIPVVTNAPPEDAAVVEPTAAEDSVASGDGAAVEDAAAVEDSTPVQDTAVVEFVADEIPLVTLEQPDEPQTLVADPVAAVPTPSLASHASDVRKRTILPADMVPNTPEAVAFLLNQPGVIAIVDARSTCGRTGIRPSELFDRIATLRDHFDVPVEVVVTPVSTPVGGAPDLPAIGVHYVTGADTVADRIRALCMGFPSDQPLVVIAGDDHVRRAAIGQEANVVEPTVVLNVATD